MITDLVVEDYQSVRRAHLKLGRFTVVTGPTGSGKSAVLRAFRLVAFNARGIAYIRRGAKSCKVGAGCRDQNWMVGIERGGRGKDMYRLVTSSQSGDAPHVEEFTKLAGAVPAHVSRALQLTPLNFAGQFDRPYLLDDSPGQVARTLGELTNVTLVFEAAREANRRRLTIAADLKRAEEQLASLTEQAKRYRGLRERREAADEARDRVDGADYIRDLLVKLRALHDKLSEEKSAVRTALRALDEAEPPSAAGLEDIQEKMGRLRYLGSSLAESRDMVLACKKRAEKAVQEEADAHKALHEALLDAGTCPTCGQEFRGSDWH